jgi:group I intron endonuclease
MDGSRENVNYHYQNGLGMKKSGIYKIQSIIKPNKVYIGSAVDINLRKWQHFNDLKKNKHGNGKLQNHYNKYGKDDLQFYFLLGCDKEDLIKTEQYFIDSYNPFFNICKKAGSSLGLKRSEETRKKIGDFWRGKTSQFKGKMHTEEAKLKNSLAHKNKPSPRKGVKLSIETKLKISLSKKGHGSFTGKHHSDATKLKISKSKLGIKLKKRL